MRKLYIVKHARDFDTIIKNGKCIKNTCFVVYSQDNNLPYNRYGISVSKKLGNAVFRNLYKRKIRSMIDNYKKDYIKGKDYIIILRRRAIDMSYQKQEESLWSLL